MMTGRFKEGSKNKLSGNYLIILVMYIAIKINIQKEYLNSKDLIVMKIKRNGKKFLHQN